MAVYRRYFKVTRMTRLPPDPRYAAQAWGMALLPIAVAFYFAPEVATLIVSGMLGPALHTAPILRVIPLGFPEWEFQYDIGIRYKTAALDEHVHFVFRIAQIALVSIWAISLVFACKLYAHWIYRADFMTNERGDARWQTPEDLAGITEPKEPNDMLLPDGYDIRAGFDKKNQAKRRARFEAATALRADRADYVADADAQAKVSEQDESP